MLYSDLYTLVAWKWFDGDRFFVIANFVSLVLVLLLLLLLLYRVYRVCFYVFKLIQFWCWLIKNSIGIFFLVLFLCGYTSLWTTLKYFFVIQWFVKSLGGLGIFYVLSNCCIALTVKVEIKFPYFLLLKRDWMILVYLCQLYSTKIAFR